METNGNGSRGMFIRCCYSYAVSGMCVLVIGAILPSIIEEAQISFTVAGGLLSMMAIGNLSASFIYPLAVRVVGQRASITVMASLVPASFLALTFLPPIALVYLLMFLVGLTRGSITIVNNSTVGVISGHSGKMLNLLHGSFATGAFLAPFLTAMLLLLGFGWRSIIFLLIFLSLTSVLSYACMDFTQLGSLEGRDRASGPSSGGHQFLASPDFYLISLLLFFYLGLENCINGWFVTYLRSTGVMSETYATAMVSVTWLFIVVGRLTCASLSRKFPVSGLIWMDTLGSGTCFLLLILSRSLSLITIALIGLGFFLAGIYPSCMALSGKTIQGSTLGVSMLTAISALGGILTPQIVGFIADRTGMVSAIALTVTNMALMVLLSLVIRRRDRRQG